MFYVNNIYYFLSISLLVISRNTAAANIADTPSAPNEFAISGKFAATLWKRPRTFSNSKKRTSPAIAIANPNSDNFQINLLSDVIWAEYFLRIFSFCHLFLYNALLFKF